MSSSKSSSMARRRFRKDECEWLALHSLQLGSRGHSEDAWRELHTGFCTRFGREDAGRMPTLEQLRKKVRHLEAQRQTSVVARAKAHIQAHAIKQEEERALAESEARRALLGTATDTDGIQRRKRRRGHAYEDARIKEEATTGNTEPARVEAVRSAETPAVESRGLLRTRPLSSLGADMPAGSANVKRVFGVRRRRFGTGAGTGSEEAIDLRDSDQERVVMQVPLVATPTSRGRVESDVTSTPLRVTESSASESSSTIGSATVLPRRPSSSSAHIDTEALLTEKLKVAERQRDEAQRDAQMWKNRFESEKTLSDMLQKRLKSALSELAEKERQLQRLEGSSRSSSNTVASPSTSSAVTFTINLQMDVTQNGERMRTVNHTLRLDGSDSSRAA